MSKKSKTVLIRSAGYGILVAAAFTLIFLHHRDTLYKHNLAIFVSWLVLCLLSGLYAVGGKIRGFFRKLRGVGDSEWVYIAVVGAMAIATRLLFLGNYPYVVLMDEVRDAGLNGLLIKTGVFRDMFAYGSYDAYGNIIPFISYLFQFVFPNSKLGYLLPTAIIGILSIGLTYILARKLYGRMTAFAATVFLSSSIFHLHYSRTQLVDICDALLSPVLIIATLYALEHPEGFFLVGLLFGFSLHFYAGIRGIVIGLSILIAIFSVAGSIKVWRKKHQGAFGLEGKRYLIILTTLIAGFLIGIGPSIEYARSGALMSNTGRTRLILHDPVFLSKNGYDKIAHLTNLYERSLATYLVNPVASIFFFSGSPVLAFPVNWLFLIGMGYLLLKKRNSSRLEYLLAGSILLFPITNQVLINDPSADHRLLSVIPLLNIAAAYGLIQLAETKFRSYAPLIIGVVTGVVFVTQTMFYFYGRPSDSLYDSQGTKEYVLQSIIDQAKRSKDRNRQYVLVSDAPYKYDFIHYREKLQYFLYPKTMSIVPAGSIELFVAAQRTYAHPTTFYYIDPIVELQSLKTKRVMVYCSDRGVIPNYYCPKDWRGNYWFYVSELD